MARHVVPTRWKSGMIEIGPRSSRTSSRRASIRSDTGIANSGLIVGSEVAVAVDALMVPSMTRRLVAAIEKTTRKPVAQLINTHHHLDHTGGQSVFFAARPSSPARMPRGAGRRDSTPPDVEGLHAAVRDEFPRLQVILPSVTFESRMVLHDGESRDPPLASGFAAHTVATPSRSCRRTGVLFAGDIAFHYVTPLAFQGHVGNWIKAADHLMRYEADVIVPGHGPIGAR